MEVILSALFPFRVSPVILSFNSQFEILLSSLFGVALAVRAIVFGFHHQVFALHPKVSFVKLQLVQILNLPLLSHLTLLFTFYILLTVHFTLGVLRDIKALFGLLERQEHKKKAMNLGVVY